MNFEQIVQALLSGESVKREDWKKDCYIKIEKDGNTTDEMGAPYIFQKSDYESKWEVCEQSSELSKAGLLLYFADLYGNKRHYRVIDDDGKYDIIDTSNWSMCAKNIGKDSLEFAMYVYGLEKENVAGKEDRQQ
ncbi:Thoeris anti-defense Tad2 family protein [Pediococcus pentosaceus]|uniref:Thoeris anti-defense Tad2 family protein n=1 Tax=Pediococcus pentosaceus TaxID=1255 RepID=UPI0018A18B09|nr:hypothetical protein [Pediococcus pentosaceus]MBF7137245.1 hypothetical protein [Pediococcus pentosaceus]